MEYRTSDKTLATFLASSGLIFKRIEWWSDIKRCDFVFEIPEAINLTSLLKQWNSSDTEFLRTMLFKSRFLANELTRFFNLQKLI